MRSVKHDSDRFPLLHPTEMPKNPDTSTNVIGLLAPIGVIVSYGLQSSGIVIPTEVQAAAASILFFGACHFIGKPSAMSRKNREVMKEFLPEAPLDPQEVREFDREMGEGGRDQ